MYRLNDFQMRRRSAVTGRRCGRRGWSKGSWPSARTDAHRTRIAPPPQLLSALEHRAPPGTAIERRLRYVVARKTAVRRQDRLEVAEVGRRRAAVDVLDLVEITVVF